jgi:hypothetical protein
MAMRTMNPRNDRYGDSSLNDAISPNVSLFCNHQVKGEQALLPLRHRGTEFFLCFSQCFRGSVVQKVFGLFLTNTNVSLFLNLFGYVHAGFALDVEFLGVVSGLIFYSMHDFHVNVHNFHSSVQHVENSKYNATKHPRVYLPIWIPSLEPLSASPTTMLKMDTQYCVCAPT